MFRLLVILFVTKNIFSLPRFAVHNGKLRQEMCFMPFCYTEFCTKRSTKEHFNGEQNKFYSSSLIKKVIVHILFAILAYVHDEEAIENFFQ